jgi:hypothetical protein
MRKSNFLDGTISVPSRKLVLAVGAGFGLFVNLFCIERPFLKKRVERSTLFFGKLRKLLLCGLALPVDVPKP